MIHNVDPEIIGGFVREVESYLPKLGESLDQYRRDQSSVESLEEAYRAVHCIRDAGSTIGLYALSQMAQYQEEALERVIAGELSWNDEVANTLWSSAERIGDYLHGIQSGDLEERSLVTDLVKAFRRMQRLPETGDAAEIAKCLGEPFDEVADVETHAAVEESLGQFFVEEPSVEAKAIPDAIPEAIPEPAAVELAPEEFSPEPEHIDAAAFEPPAEEPALDFAPVEPDFHRPDNTMQTIDEPAVDEDLWAAFQEESTEHFEKLAVALAKLEAGPDPDALKTIRRSVHQLKGASGVIGMLTTSKLNAGMQKVLDSILEGERPYNPELLGLFQATFEVVIESVGGHGSGVNLADRAQALMEQYDALLAAAPQLVETGIHAESPLASVAGTVDRVDVGDDLWEAFTQEAEEHLTNIGELLRSMERQAPDQSAIQSMRRSVHTYKGACGVVGLRLTSSIAHRMEDLLDSLYEGRLTFHSGHTPLLFATYDVLTDSVAARGIREQNRSKLEPLFIGYQEALSHAAAPETMEEMEARLAQEQPAPILDLETLAAAGSRRGAQFVRAPLEKVDELVRLVSELVIHRSRFEQYLAGYVHEVSELHLSIERLNRVSRRLQSDYEATALQEANRRFSFSIAGSFAGSVSAGRGGFVSSPVFGGGSSAEDFDALEFDRYTEFHLLSRDLAETTGDVTNAGSRLNDLISDFDGYLNRLSTLTGEVEDRLMRLRMLPLGHLSSRLHRTVRVTAERRNKAVELRVEGEAVELDKTVLEEMAGPLDHLLRNAVDHGIEPAAVRTRTGKPESGTIHLRAFNEGTQVVLQVRDDGKGIDPEKLRESAVRNGYVAQEDAGILTESELYSLMFLPGFSTASELSEVSGRGVGLDVVKAAVNKMKGTISINSERGTGTTFTIRLPMTLALTRVVLVKSGSEQYAIPLAAVSQVLRIEPEQLERVGRKPVLRLGGKVVPTMHLAEVAGQQLPPDANLTRLKAVVLNIGDQRMALMVDQVVEAREVVVKTIGSLLGHVHGVTGATIMGDGSVVLILNPNDMLMQQHTVSPQARLRAVQPPKTTAETYEVLIVDDSPSVRRVLTNLIRNAGWTPRSAKDGLEALEMIHSGAARPDVLLLDIEMPRMDGYELTAALRNMPRHRQTPIVMLTSRAGEKHRKRAFELGANEYMIKPYQDDALLSVVRRAVNKSRGVILQ
ncbi:MAG: Hpt domain-containing protein [Acidobacteria bacterium]|nr:Hpt domain-containing protein [Acidobacteriota bacterium]